MSDIIVCISLSYLCFLEFLISAASLHKTVKYIFKKYLIPSKNVSKNIWKMHVYCQNLGQTKLLPKSNPESDYKIEGKCS